MHDLAVEQEGDGGEADMGMRPHVDSLADMELGRPEMIEEDEGSDHASLGVRERAANGEMADIDAARHDHEIDGISGARSPGAGSLPGKKLMPVYSCPPSRIFHASGIEISPRHPT